MRLLLTCSLLSFLRLVTLMGLLFIDIYIWIMNLENSYPVGVYLTLSPHPLIVPNHSIRAMMQRILCSAVSGLEEYDVTANPNLPDGASYPNCQVKRSRKIREDRRGVGDREGVLITPLIFSFSCIPLWWTPRHRSCVPPLLYSGTSSILSMPRPKAWSILMLSTMHKSFVVPVLASLTRSKVAMCIRHASCCAPRPFFPPFHHLGGLLWTGWPFSLFVFP